jgi:dienelactone hydrolase
VIHEWWGLNDYARHRARQLAELGYVAFALDMYGDGKATAHPDQAKAWMQKITENVDQWRQRASAGLEVLKKQDHVDVDRLGAVGYCFGGATVQQLAYSGASLKGVVSFHGSPISPSVGDAERTRASILLCHGAADPFVSFPSLKTYLEAMNGTDLDWQLVFYGGAKHSFTNPKANEAGMPALGYDKKADHRSWDHMKQFFEDLF